jgi:endothelin-converting enzyme/putative endopeptidase
MLLLPFSIDIGVRMRNTFRYAFVAVCAILVLSGMAVFAQQAPAQATHGISVNNLDRSVNPGDDFFRFANGDWLKRTEIPPDRGSVGVFTVLGDLANKRTAGIIEDVAKSNPAAGTSSRKIGDVFNSYMNEQAIEAKGLTPIQPELKKIAAIKNKTELARAFGESLRADVDPLNNTNFHTANLFGLWVAPAFEDADHYTAYLLQGGITLPEREYYLSKSPRMQEIRTTYQAHVAAVLKLAGFTDTDTRAARIVALEHSIAEKHENFADEQDVIKANNTWKQTDFTAKAPGLDWTEFFRAAGLGKQVQFTVWQPEAFTGESALVASVPLDTWKDWLSYHLIERYSGVLPKAFADERFDFFGKTLTGTPQQRPRWQRGVFVVNDLLGDAVGQIYAKKYFSPEAKAKAQDMVANIIEAFRKRIDALTWMDPATKTEAKDKLNTLYVGVGYPEKWRDYSALEIKPDDIIGNLQRGSLFEYHRQVSRLGTVVDKKEWSMTPQTVNAVNLPLQNALNFPAAILEPPFFDANAPAAANYGAIGSVIGHEISHSFDTAGSTFDSQGRLRNWWTKADFAHFEAATQKLAQQYDTYKPFPDLAVNGQQTLAENIADVAGISAAFDGYRASLDGKPAPEQDGFTGDQQFFIAFGQNYASKTREAAQRQQVMTDTHSPGEYRADTVRNIDAWYSSFDVPPTAKLYLAPTDRVRIW